MSKIKDPKLADQGKLKIGYAKANMAVLEYLKNLYEVDRPLDGVKIGACLHVTKESAVLADLLKSAGADVKLCGSNPLTTKDDVAASLVRDYGIDVYAWNGETPKEYWWCIEQVVKDGPDITMDDGADLTVYVSENCPDLVKNIIGGTEETTTGVKRLKAMAKKKKLKYPIIAVNDAKSKTLLDNVFGTGQSTIDGILRATNVLLGGKTFVIAGYGYCGRGLAKRAKGMGSKVVVTEVDHMKALEALYDGYSVMPMEEAAKIGDIFVTVTGNISVIKKEHFELMKDGAILANAGHFNVEIDVGDLEKIATEKRNIRPNLDEYNLSSEKRLYLIAEGRLCNLVAGEGHPSEVMQSSFANQFLAVLYLLENGDRLKKRVYKVPEKLDKKVAGLTLDSYGVKIDKLTEKQKKYLGGYNFGA